ncbi:hypothetical protein [Bosea massiliensis]|uniref:Uncharacterized protein n=1 Tax=Bosea massiliensis TaxID=151419 RepID=A0ABW0PCW0_9HYPH
MGFDMMQASHSFAEFREFRSESGVFLLQPLDTPIPAIRLRGLGCQATRQTAPLTP